MVHVDCIARVLVYVRESGKCGMREHYIGELSLVLLSVGRNDMLCANKQSFVKAFNERGSISNRNVPDCANTASVRIHLDKVPVIHVLHNVLRSSRMTIVAHTATAVTN